MRILTVELSEKMEVSEIMKTFEDAIAIAERRYLRNCARIRAHNLLRYVRGIERENVGLWNGYVILYIVQECGVNPLFILCSQTHDIIKLISNSYVQPATAHLKTR